LSEKYFIVSGTNRGLGLALLEELISLNDFKLIFCLNRKLNIGMNSNKVIQLEIDLNNFEKLTELIDNDIIPKIPLKSDIIFINNAATIQPIEFSGNLNNEDFIQTFQVNSLAGCLISSKLTNHFYLNSTIRIINITSGAANRPIKGWSLYCSSKAYIKMFLEVLKLEYPNINLTQYDPGTMDTSMQEMIRSKSELKYDNSYFIDLKKNKNLNSTKIVAHNIIKEIIENSNTL